MGMQVTLDDLKLSFEYDRTLTQIKKDIKKRTIKKK